ncbi:hypothetical protein ACHWQZ_G010818 [Mnemiopsis leidyi]
MNRPNPPITDIGLPLDTEYADDIDFNDEDEENLKALLPIATEVLKDWNLFVNEDKTDFTHVYLAEKGVKDDQGKPIAGNKLWRKSITLGSMLCSKEDISRRISLGYAAFNKYKKAWNHRIPLNKRLLLYEALVFSVLMYNSSCWAAPKSVLEKLDIAHRRHLRSILNYKYPHHISNKILYKRCNAEPFALEILPKKKKRRKENPYKDPNIDHHRHVLQQSALEHRTAPSFSTKEKLEEAKKQLDEAYTTATKQFVEKQTSFLEKSNPEHRHHSSWKIIRDLTSSNAVPFSKIPGGTTEERLNIWYEHFKSLLGSSSCPADLSSPFFNNHVSKSLPINCEPFDLPELEEVLDSLNSSKSPGLDNIPPTVWKLKPFRRDLLGFCNEALVNGRVPDAWTTASIIPIPKKGDLSKPGNYRGISLAPILALRRIIEECRIGKKSAAIVFVDFSKAFDSINRDALFHILSLYGIPAPIIKAIRLLYDTAKSRVQTSDGLTDFFETLIGVLQGDTLAPFLFIMVLDYILRNCMSPDYGLIITPRQSRRIPAVTVTDLDFADDLALLSNTIQEAQSLLNDLEVAAEKVGLCMNSSKTEFMTINIDSEKALIKSKGGHSLEHVDDFKYLGSYIADSKQDFNTRKGMAWTACIKLQKVWTSGISEHLKVKFFKACVEPVLLYGSETWTLNKQFEKRLNGCYTRLLMKAKNLHWKDHPTLNRIYGDLPAIATVLAQRRARFAGHCMRAHDQIISTVLPWRLPQTGRGRRPLTFLDTVARDAGVEIGDLRGVMLDRTVWRKIVEQFSIEDRPK